MKQSLNAFFSSYYCNGKFVYFKFILLNFSKLFPITADEKNGLKIK